LLLIRVIRGYNFAILRDNRRTDNRQKDYRRIDNRRIDFKIGVNSCNSWL